MIPEAFNDTTNLVLHGAYDDITVINGSLNLNGANLAILKNVSFRGSEESTTAIHNGTLNPGGSATRAQVAQMLMNFMMNI